MPHPFYGQIIRIASECAEECNICAVACLQEPEVEHLRDCILLDLDCADVCRTLVTLLARTSQFSRDLLQLAASISEQCAEVCEKHRAMEHCRRCAEICRNFSNEAKNFALA